MAVVKDITGEKFGKLTVVEFVGVKNHRAQWLCRCDCGNEKLTNREALQSGHTMSCGCYQKQRQSEGSATHGDSKSRLYRTYHHMLGRCTNSGDNMYAWYGAKGVSVCDEWSGRYEAFRDWALSNGYDDTLSIDRIDSDKDYEPGNVRWIPLHANVMHRHESKRRKIGKKLPLGVYRAYGGGYKSHAFNTYLGTYETIEEASRMREIAAVV